MCRRTARATSPTGAWSSLRCAARRSAGPRSVKRETVGPRAAGGACQALRPAGGGHGRRPRPAAGCVRGGARSAHDGTGSSRCRGPARGRQPQRSRAGALAQCPRIADLGSGAGFPGLPLAIALPDSRVDLVESARRKCAVIDRLAAAAGVENARSLPLRVEELAAGDGRSAYDAVTARALAPLPVLVEYAAPLLRQAVPWWLGRGRAIAPRSGRAGRCGGPRAAARGGAAGHPVRGNRRSQPISLLEG